MPNQYPELFHLKIQVQDSDLAHFLEDGAKVKNFLRLNNLYYCQVELYQMFPWNGEKINFIKINNLYRKFFACE